MQRILIEGIGGIGGVLAGKLYQAGHKPVLVTHNDGITSAINDHGIKVKTPEESFTIPARACTSLQEAGEQGPFDAALLLMKATAVVKAAERTLPLLAEQSGFLVPMQNGIVEDAVAEAVGADRVVSGIIGWGGTMHGPGDYERTGPGVIHLGELEGPATPRVRELASLIELATPVVVCDNMRGALWSKLAINCTITSGGALTGQTLGEMLRDRRVRQAFLVIYREVVDTALAQGLTLERIAANPYLLYLPADAGPVKRFIKDTLMRVVGLKHGKLKSSSLQSLERGRKTEIDFLNGHVVDRAAELGTDASLNATLVRLIKEIEAGKRKIAPANLDDLLAEV